jgi:phosphatidylserine/phosphatidylglycerophosphate/cardiolipin synthase-like enzyme
VLTSAPVLSALADVLDERRVDATGIVDITQCEQALAQWHNDDHVSWKAPILERVLAGLGFSGKRSTPYAPGSVHDFMHAKISVIDDVVFAGSYNLSRSGEENAENVLEIADAQLAERIAAWIDGLRARYPPARPSIRP